MSDGLLSLCWNNHISTFSHIVSTLREKERYSDATLACNGKFYPVHKLILSVCSDYFGSILDCTPCKHPVVVLRDVEPTDMEALLSYMYEGNVSVAQSDLARLIKTAEMLKIKGLAVPDDDIPSNRKSSNKSSKRERGSPTSKRKRHSSSDNNESKRSNTDQEEEGFLNVKQEQIEQDSPIFHESNSNEVFIEDSKAGIDLISNDFQDDGMSTCNISRDISQQHHVNDIDFDNSLAENYESWPSGADIDSADYNNEFNIGGSFSESNPMGSKSAKHQCPVCPFSSNYKNVLTRHVRIHTGEKPYGCRYCPYVSGSRDNVTTHERTHTGEKPFKCSVCPYSAAQKCSVQKHELVHLNEKN